MISPGASTNTNTVLGVCCPVSSPDLQPPAVQSVRGEDQGQDERVLQVSHHGGGGGGGGAFPQADRGGAGGEAGVPRLVPGQPARPGEMSACPAEQLRGPGEWSVVSGQSEYKSHQSGLTWLDLTINHLCSFY